MKQSVEQFYEELADCLQRYLPGGEIEVIEMNMLRLKVRIYIAVSFFMLTVHKKLVSRLFKKEKESSVLTTSMVGTFIPLANLKIMFK